MKVVENSSDLQLEAEEARSEDILAEFESDTCVYKRVKDEKNQQLD